MTRLDIIKAIMAGAGVSEVAAIRALHNHDESVRAQVLADKARRETIATALLGGLLCSSRMVAPEELVKRALQHTDILIGAIDK